MLLVPELCLRPADLADWIPDFPRFQVFAASLVTLIASCGCPAMGANPFDISIREKPPAFRAIRLMHDLLVYIAVFDKFGNNSLGAMMCRRVIGHTKLIEDHSHSLKCLLEMAVVTLGECPWGDPRFLSRHNDGGSVII